MIIIRYLSRQVVLVTLAISFILLVVVVVARMLKYLAQASEGELDPSVLVVLMSYRLPEFIQLIIPLALLLGILIAYGRMYAESEMTVLRACGLSQRRLLAITLGVSLGFAVLVGGLSLFLTPWGLVNTERLLEAQEELTEFDILIPGVFQSMSGGQRTTYTESVDGELINKVFIHETEGNRVTVAQTAITAEDGDGERLIQLQTGNRTEGIAGEGAYSLTEFDELGVRLPRRELNFEITLEEKALPTSALMTSEESAHRAELQWRISLVILVPILTLLAIPLSRVSPREGRFARLVPAIFCYISYFGLLLGCRDLIGRGSLPVIIGMWWVHGLFLALGLLLMVEKIPASVTELLSRRGNAKD